MNSKSFIILILAALAILGGAYFMSLPNTPEPEMTSDALEAAEEKAQDLMENPSQDVDAFIPPSTVTGVDIAAAKEARILGNPNAPIKISEHSSFTCGHCGKFHREAFPQVKLELVDSGQAYIVFSDFPLNAPALHASMVARCLPDKDRYFDFVQMLFEDQESWAYERNYINILKSKAEEYGLNQAGFKACLESKDLQEAIVAGAKAAQAQWNVSSTPSFVINNKTVIAGGSSAASFITRVKEAANGESETNNPEGAE